MTAKQLNEKRINLFTKVDVAIGRIKQIRDAGIYHQDEINKQAAKIGGEFRETYERYRSEFKNDYEKTFREALTRRDREKSALPELPNADQAQRLSLMLQIHGSKKPDKVRELYDEALFLDDREAVYFFESVYAPSLNDSPESRLFKLDVDKKQEARISQSAKDDFTQLKKINRFYEQVRDTEILTHPDSLRWIYHSALEKAPGDLELLFVEG